MLMGRSAAMGCSRLLGGLGSVPDTTIGLARIEARAASWSTLRTAPSFMESLGTDSPHRLGRYVLGVRLAVGGMAEVWLARQDGPANFTKQLVVKKILPQYAADDAFVEMF